MEEDLALSDALLDLDEAEFDPGSEFDETDGTLLALDAPTAVPSSDVVGSETDLAATLVVCTHLRQKYGLHQEEK